MSKEVERGTETETTLDSEGKSVTVTRSYERVTEIVAKELQPILKNAAREMRAYMQEEGKFGKIATGAYEACLGVLTCIDRSIIAKGVNMQTASGKTASGRTAGGRWVWRVNRVDNSGILLVLTYETGSSGFRLSDNIRMVKELERKALSEVSLLVKEGVPINISTLQVDDPEFEIVDNKLEIFARINIRWVSGQSGWTNFDIEEAMMEAGLT